MIKFQSKQIKEMDTSLCSKEHERNDIPKTFILAHLASERVFVSIYVQWAEKDWWYASAIAM